MDVIFVAVLVMALILCWAKFVRLAVAAEPNWAGLCGFLVLATFLSWIVGTILEGALP